MPPSQIKVPQIKAAMGNVTNAQYNSARETLYCFIVNIGYYHLWFYDIPDRENIWTKIFRIFHTIIPATVADPAPGVHLSNQVLMGVFQMFIPIPMSTTNAYLRDMIYTHATTVGCMQPMIIGFYISPG